MVYRPSFHGSLAVVLFALLVSGCSTSRFAVGAMVPVLDNARDTAMASDDVRTFRDAAPANLFLLEGLIATDPDRSELRLDAAMLYFSYAFSFIESTSPAYASSLYQKGFHHGRAALLKNKKLPRDWDIPLASFTTGLKALRKKDVPAAVWTAVNWAQFISLHLDSIAVLRDIPKVSSLLERVGELDGSYFDGMVYAMIGSLHAFRPPLMGGSPEKSRENFEKSFRVSGGRFLLSRYLYARFYLYRIQDGAAFEKTLTGIIRTPEISSDPYRLLNRIARSKSRDLLGEFDDLF